MSLDKIKKLHKELDYVITVKKLKDVDCIVLQFPKINIRESNISGKTFLYSFGDSFVQLFSDEDDIYGQCLQCPPYAKLAIIYTDIVLKLLNNNLHTDLVSVYDNTKQINGLSSLYRIVPFSSKAETEKAKHLLTLANDFLLGESGANLAQEQDISEGYELIINIVHNLGIYDTNAEDEPLEGDEE